MALKTSKKTYQKNYLHSQLRWQIAVRNPDFSKALIQLFKKIDEINEKFGLPSITHPDYKSAVKKLDAHSDLERMHVILPLIEKLKEKFNLSTIEVNTARLPDDIRRIFNIFTAPVRFLWNENPHPGRYIDLRIDALADLEVIKCQVGMMMKVICNGEKEGVFKIPGRESHKLHLSKASTYIRVFDMRKRKPPVPYEEIATKLQKDGFYKGLTLKKVVNSARHDFSLIFEEIYGVPFKQYDAKKFKSAGIKECAICEKRSQCKELCAPISYLLSLEEVKQQHFISTKADAREQYRDTHSEEDAEEHANI